jgi:adenylate kinase
MRIVLMGPPGAGKGTQAVRLVNAFGMTHLSSGDMFRAEKASGSELGQQLASYMDAGLLVPDDTVVEMMAGVIGRTDGALMLDGFPRTVVQAEALDDTLVAKGTPLEAVVVIGADNDVIIKRVTGRRACPKCGKGFHIEYMPSANVEFCDACGEGKIKLTQRADDTEETVRDRLGAYQAQTEPVIEYYRDQGKVDLIEVNGNGSADEIAGELVAELKTLGV